MKITLYNATSIDGFIATKEKDSEWVSDVDAAIFENMCQEKGCIFVGRRTFEQYYEEIYPVNNVMNIVLTTDRSKTVEYENVMFAHDIEHAINLAQENGYEDALLVGGGTTNTSFLKANKISEIILSVHPLVLGSGISIFEGFDDKIIDLDLADLKKLDEGLVQLHYQVTY